MSTDNPLTVPIIQHAPRNYREVNQRRSDTMWFTCHVRRIFGGFIILIIMLSILIPCATSAAKGGASISLDSTDSPSPTASEFSTEEIEMLFEQYGLEHYAYMDLDTADPELHPVILGARSRIIYSETAGWVADEIDGCIKDAEGNIIEVLPHFHDIFPEDWDLPPRYVNTNE